MTKLAVGATEKEVQMTENVWRVGGEKKHQKGEALLARVGVCPES